VRLEPDELHRQTVALLKAGRLPKVCETFAFLLSHVVAITVALVASAAVGLLLAGFISQVLAGKMARAGDNP